MTCFRQDLDDEPTFNVRGYDYLLLLDVIEHLKEPERFLERLRAQFDYSPTTLVLTTPNIAFAIQRRDAPARAVQLRQGRHPRPHAHAAVYVPIAAAAARRCRVPDQGDSRRAGAVSEGAGQRPAREDRTGNQPALIRISRTMFSYQIFVVAGGTPDVDFILQDSKERSMSG